MWYRDIVLFDDEEPPCEEQATLPTKKQKGKQAKSTTTTAASGGQGRGQGLGQGSVKAMLNQC